MGLLDNLGKGGLFDQLSGGGRQSSLLGAVAQLLRGGNVGGLSGLTQLFHQRGHGDKIDSWVSTGENRSISPEEMQDVLGQDRIQQLAQSAGMSEPDTSRGLSKLLPQLVDKLTPDGRLPDNESAHGSLSQLASRFLKH
jgi:uncharacterized protein YidB (DUF937 family)